MMLENIMNGNPLANSPSRSAPATHNVEIELWRFAYRKGWVGAVRATVRSRTKMFLVGRNRRLIKARKNDRQVFAVELPSDLHRHLNRSI